VGLRRRREVLASLAAVWGETLGEHRAKIDAVDRRIVGLLDERAQAVLAIGRLKRRKGLPLEAPAREQEVLRHAAAAARVLPGESVRRIYQQILAEMKAAERIEIEKA